MLSMRTRRSGRAGPGLAFTGVLTTGLAPVSGSLSVGNAAVMGVTSNVLGELRRLECCVEGRGEGC